LVVAELFQNALEHGLADSGDLLQISVKNEGKNYIVSVVNNGAGLPKDFNIESSANLGLQIANTLTKNELAGEIKLSSDGSQTAAVITFSVA
jgi:two-component sensor histidine kinase